ncbi:unnamed protein product [Amaranthus hypochondriacus]
MVRFGDSLKEMDLDYLDQLEEALDGFDATCRLISKENLTNCQMFRMMLGILKLIKSTNFSGPNQQNIIHQALAELHQQVAALNMHTPATNSRPAM